MGKNHRTIDSYLLSLPTPNRFEINTKHINSVQQEIKILEEWLGIKPFAPYTRVAKLLKE